MRFIHCSNKQHALAIIEIFNEAILNSTALYDYKPRPPESMVSAPRAKGRLLLAQTCTCVPASPAIPPWGIAP